MTIDVDELLEKDWLTEAEVRQLEEVLLTEEERAKLINLNTDEKNKVCIACTEGCKQSNKVKVIKCPNRKTRRVCNE